MRIWGTTGPHRGYRESFAMEKFSVDIVVSQSQHNWKIYCFEKQTTVSRRIYIDIYMYSDMYVCMYVCMYVYTYTDGRFIYGFEKQQAYGK